MDARKTPYTKDDLAKLFQGAEKILIASGKKILEFQPGDIDSETFQQKAIGRTGNLRAPTIMRDGVIYIEFSDSMYDDLFK